MRIFLIRHADPYYPTDSLTPAGQLEAAALAEHLSEIGLDEIYVSPRGRARLTAQSTVDRLARNGQHPPVSVLDWTTELDGLWDEAAGHSLWDMDAEYLRRPEAVHDLNNWQRAAPFDHPRLAEHIQRIHAGSDAFLAQQGFTRAGHIFHFNQPNRKRIAVFAHLAFGLTWLAELLGMPLPFVYAGFYLHPSSITTILLDERRPGAAVPRLTGLGDISHLHRAGLPASNAGLIANAD